MILGQVVMEYYDFTEEFVKNMFELLWMSCQIPFPEFIELNCCS